MSNIIDMKMVTYAGDNLIDGEYSWLASWGGTAESLIDRWMEVLTDKGFTQNSLIDKKIAWLQAQTGLDTNNLIDLQKYALENGVYTFAPVIALWDGNKGISLNGSDVASWTDQVNGIVLEQSTESEQPSYSNGVLSFDVSAGQYLAVNHVDAFDFGTDDFSYVSASKTSTSYAINGAVFATGILNGNTAGFGHFYQLSTNTLNTQIRKTTTAIVSLPSDVPKNDGNLNVIDTLNSSGNKTFYINSTLQASNSSTVVDLDGTGNGMTTVGARDSTSTIAQFLDGDVMQIVVFGDSRKSGEIQNMSNQLNSKWG